MEGLGIIVVFGEIAVNGGLKIGDGAEDGALEPLARELGEEVLHGIKPGAGCRCEVEGSARMTREPGEHLWVLVRPVIVEDDVDELPGWDFCFDGIEEANELLMTVPLHAAADDRAFEDVQGREQGRCAVALVVVGHRRRA